MAGQSDFMAQGINPGDSEMYMGNQIHDNLLALKIMYLGGIISADQLPTFRRLVIRATRCQVYVHSFEFLVNPEDQIVGDNYDSKKYIFVLAF
jgi:hypothetical protein